MRERWLPVEETMAHLIVNPEMIYKWTEGKKLLCHKMERLGKSLASIALDVDARDARQGCNRGRDK